MGEQGYLRIRGRPPAEFSTQWVENALGLKVFGLHDPIHSITESGARPVWQHYRNQKRAEPLGHQGLIFILVLPALWLVASGVYLGYNADIREGTLRLLRQRNGDTECDGFSRTILCSRTAAREIHVA